MPLILVSSAHRVASDELSLVGHATGGRQEHDGGGLTLERVGGLGGQHILVQH